MTATDHDFKIKNGARVSGEKLILGSSAYSADANYVGLKTSAMTGSTEYMIISAPTDKHTYISAGSGKAVYIRGGGNNTAHQLVVENTGATFAGNLTVTGNLTVEGSQTVLETTTLSVEDKNITLNYGSGDTSGSANGAGITIQDAVNSSTDATILWDATNDRFDFSHPIQIKSGTAASSPNIFRVLSALESNTNKGDVYAGIELGVTGAENSTGNVTNGVVAAIKAVDFRNGATSYEDSGLGFYTLGASDSSPIFRGGFSNEGGLHISNDGSIDELNAGNLQVDGITYANGGLYVGGVQILNTSGSIIAQTFDATDRDFVVTDTNESITNIIWKDDSEGKLYLGTSTFPAEFRSNINMQTGHAFQMNGTTVIDSSRNAILQGLRASTTESATSSTGINFTATDTVSNQNFTAVRIDHNASGSQTHTGDNAHYALFIDQDSSASGGDTTNEHRLYGIYSDQRISASGDSDVMYSIFGYSESQHSSGQVSGVHGGYFVGKADDTGTGHTASIYGVLGLAQADNTGSGGTSNLYGVYGKSILSASCDKNTNSATGVYAEVEIDDPGQAQTLSAAYVLRTEYDDDSAGNVTVNSGYLFYGNVSGTPATNMYGMYFADDLRHHFKGTLEARGADTDISTALAYGFASDRNTGMYSPENHVLGFANAGTERARLSGGNWLFHKQTDGLDGVGVEFASSGRARFTRDGNNVIEINRKSSDGSLVTLYNGASNLIGQINVINSLMALGTGAAGLIFNNTSDAIYPWNVAGGTGSDAALDLGISSRRWRDMHLGRTLYMNGGGIQLRNDTSGDNTTIREISFNTTGANGTDDRVAIISATTSGGTSTTRGGKLGFFTRDPNADSFNEIHVTNAGNLNIVDGGLQTANTQRISNAGELTNIGTATLSGAIYSNIGTGGTSLYCDATSNYVSGNTFYAPGIRWRQDDQTSIAGIRGAISSDGTNQLILGTGWLDQEMFIEPSRVRIAGDLQVDGNDVTLAATNKRVKYSVWSNDTYGIGMHNTVTYGGINNDYAMTFQMNNDVDRGWLFLDSDDTLAQGAMALTTEGKLTVADSIRLGYGKNDTTSPGLNSLDLEVSGISKFDSQIRAGSGSQTLPAFSFSSDTNTGFYRSSENVLGVATGGDTRAIFDNEAFQIEGGAGLRLKAGGRSDNPEGTYYNWFQTGAGTDTTSWWKICDVDINTGLYRALAMHIRVKSQYGNYGSTEQVVFSEYTAFFPRSGAVQDDAGTPRLSGYDTENHELRIYKTGNGAYELQSRMKLSYRDLIVELQVLSTNGGTVTINESLSAGTTSGGTAYAATAHTANSAPEFYTGKLFAPSLGIGTDDPVALLDVKIPNDTVSNVLAGSYAAAFSSTTSGNTGHATGILLSGSSGSNRGAAIVAEAQSTGNDHDLIFATSASGAAPSEHMRIDSDGNIGIGVSAPSTKLHLYTGGLVANTGVTDMLRIELNRGDHSTTPSGPAILFKDQDSNNLTNEARIKMMTVNDTDYGDNDEAASNLLFETTNGGTASDKMIITGRGDVGIGTVNPTQKLDVVGNIKAGGVSHPELELVPTGSVGNADIRFNGTTFDIRSNSSSADLTLQTSTTERLRITATGNVGIGEDDTASINDARLVIRDGNYGNNQDGGIIIQAGDATGYHWRAGFKIKSSSTGSPRTVIDTVTGNTGGFIEALSFASATGAATFASSITLPLASPLYFGGGSHTYITEDIDDRLRFFTGGTEFMRFTESTTNTLSLYQPVSATSIQASGDITSSGQVTGISLQARNDSGYGSVEVGGSSGAFIDLKKPATDDYDVRIVTDAGTGGRIQSNGVFDIDASGNMTFDADGGTIDLKDNGSSMASFTTSAATFAGTISSGAITASGDIRLNKEGTATVSNQVYASRDLQFLASGWDTNNSVARDVMWKVRNVPTASVYPDYDLQFIESDQGSDYIRFKLHGRGSTNHTDPMSATFYGNVAIEAGTGTNAGAGDLTVADAISGGSFKLGATTIIDGSANLTSIGTISSGAINITTAAVPLSFTESGHSGNGQYWRMPLDGGNLRFDVSTGGANFTTYDAILQLNSAGTIDIQGSQMFDASGNINTTKTISSGNITAGTISGSALTVTNSGMPTLTLYDNGNGGGGGAEAKIEFTNNDGTVAAIGYTDDSVTDTDLIISTNAAGTYGGYLGLDAAAIADSQSDIILEPKTNVRIATGGLKIGTTTFVDSSRNIAAGTISSGAITSSGTITASGGNSGNWNTAYGWGNHASAGYITNSTASLDANKITSGVLDTARIPTPVNGSWWNGGAVKVYSDGVMEVGKYLDFHTANSGGNVDYDLRLTASAGALTVGGTISSGAITSSGATTTLGDSGTNGTINMRATSNFYLQQNGSTRLTINSSGITSSSKILTADGSQSAPTHTFTSDTDTGMYRVSADTIGFATGGARRGYFNSSGFSSDSNVYTATSGTFRNYGGVWSASTGLTGNGFTFLNSVDGTAMTISSTGDVVCTGSLSATTKSFDIEHPTKEGMRLHHGSLEGPEHGVYIRGRNKGTVIELPEYWLGLVDESTITVQLTAIGEPQSLCVTDIKDNKVYVEGVEYFYFIQAERKDIEKFEVEYAV